MSHTPEKYMAPFIAHQIRLLGHSLVVMLKQLITQFNTFDQHLTTLEPEKEVMATTLSDIATDMGAGYTVVQQFVSGVRRSELMCRRVSDYTGLPWQYLRDMNVEKLEAVLMHTYLLKKHPWLVDDTEIAACDYEKGKEACA